MMTIDALLAANNISIPSTAPGRYYTICPNCSRQRAKPHQRCKVLGVTVDAKGARWGCNHCGWTGAEKGNGSARHADDLKTYDYGDESGELVFQKVRFPDKQFRQRKPDGKGGWIWKLGDTRKVIYRLQEVNEAIASSWLIACVEGEKDADNLWRIGVPATCNPDGAAEPGQRPKWRKEYSEMLRGADVVAMGDNDPAGRSHQEATASSLLGVATGVRVLDPKCWEPGKDVSDWLAAGHTREELDALIQQTPDYRQTNDSWQDEGGTFREPSTKSDLLESTAASTYTMRAVQWFWPNRFALGKIGLISGLPDRGKGLIVSQMIATATKGGKWPCTEGHAPQGKVLLLTAEDDIEDTVIPRLVGAGAELDRVHIVKMVRHVKGKRIFSLVTDLDLLRQKIKEIGDVVLIIIDPMSAYVGIGQIDSYRTTDVRGVLAPLKELAEETMIAIIGVMHFNKKADVHNAMLRIADSLAYVAAARHCYVVVDDAENQRRLFIKAKNNLAPDMAALSYTIDTKKVGTDQGTAIIAPYVVWGSDHVYVSATEAMQAEEKGASNERPRDTAKEFLANLLAMGAAKQKDIMEAAEAHMISAATLRRAKDDLKIKTRKDGKGPWMWELPKRKDAQEGS